MPACPTCAGTIDPGSRFCPHCGERLYRPCPSCDEEVALSAAYCPRCGSRTDHGQASASESEVRLATVLFGDVKGFTAMSEKLAPEEVTDIMNRCFEALSQPVIQYGGTVDKYVGDAIMARFGAPRAHEDDSVRAIFAALAMQQSFGQIAADLHVERGLDLAMRIGINTGQVLAGEVGSAAFRQFTLMGNAVNVASRLEHEAPPGGVLVGESTYRLARHAFEFRAMPPLEIRGQSQLVPAYVPIRSRTRGPRLELDGRRLNLVGRDVELSLLEGALDDAYHGEGRIVALVGEPGAGKTRLADEFCSRHAQDDMARAFCASPSFGQSIPYATLAAFIRSVVFEDVEQSDITANELRSSVRTLLPEQGVDDATALLGEALGISDASHTDVSNLDARSRQAMLAGVLKLLLAGRSRERPFVLVLDDLHWADSASLEVLDQALSAIQTLRVMVVITYRTRFSHRWSGMTYYREVHVRELPPSDSTRLLQEVLGSLELPPLLGERVMEKTGGNPFFIEQVMNSLIESGTIVRQDGKWAVARDISSLTVPDTIQEIVLARIDQLSRSCRSVLEVAAVIGRVFAHKLLQTIVEAERNLDLHLQLLQRQEFIFEKSFLPELEYMFKHALTHDVVYGGLLEARRRAFHERVAQTVESMGDEPSGEQLPILAFHYSKTTNWDKALHYVIAAAERSRQLYANEEAAAFLQQALNLVDRGAKAHRSRKPVLLESLGDVYALQARFQDAQESYRQAGEESDEMLHRARVSRKMGDVEQSRGQYGTAMTHYREAQELLRETEDPAEQACIWLSEARMDRARGALDSGAATCLRALSLTDHMHESAQASLFFELGQIERERGRLRGAAGYLEAASDAWRRMGMLEKQALVAEALGSVSFNRGDLNDALASFQKALEIRRRLLDTHGSAATLLEIGRTRLAIGDLEDAISCQTEALALGTEVGDAMLVPNCNLQLGLVYLERANFERGEPLVDSAYAQFKRIRNWKGIANCLVARSRVLRSRGDLAAARRALTRAESLGREMGDARSSRGVGRGGRAGNASRRGGRARAGGFEPRSPAVRCSLDRACGVDSRTPLRASRFPPAGGSRHSSSRRPCIETRRRAGGCGSRGL